MSEAPPTVLVLGRRTTDNMPSLTRMLEILKPRDGMDVAPCGSVRITRTCPKMGGGNPWEDDPNAPIPKDPGPKPKAAALPDHCSITGTQTCPDDQAVIDTCPTC